jgi:hypothetical protein
MTIEIKMLADIRDAVRKIDEIHAKHGKPPKELPMHPDDIEEVKRRFKPMLTHPANRNGDSIMGIRLVPDETAERLLRKVEP